ncbi:hypothetical protein Ddye_005681 [Dipteronia dyeriana]|uniref:Uncharacterized protein n=1 Tax=Dipteronia dyeriana TaxID=168575 RepID=A0AAD9XGX9_9ROSI|nr:hypothetical protein Ddye_005681 [Dipteronia dyeriana]
MFVCLFALFCVLGVLCFSLCFPLVGRLLKSYRGSLCSFVLLLLWWPLFWCLCSLFLLSVSAILSRIAVVSLLGFYVLFIFKVADALKKKSLEIMSIYTW